MSAPVKPFVFAVTLPAGPIVDPKTGQPSFAFMKWLQNLQQAFSAAFTQEGGLSPDSIPFPTATALGGVTTAGPISHQWIMSIGSDGIPVLAQIAFADLGGTATADQIPQLAALRGSVVPSQVPPLPTLLGQATPGQVPTLDQLNGQITTTQLPALGPSVTIATAKLTTLGADGSMTFVNGILTAQVQAT
jgi:hypothetical protein